MMKSSRHGATAIEFALTLPLFVALVAAIMEYGWMFYVRLLRIDWIRLILIGVMIILFVL